MNAIPATPRRHWLKLATVAASVSALNGNNRARPAGAANSQTGLGPPPTRTVHFLNRISYGVTAETKAAVDAEGWQAILQRQLDYRAIDDSALEDLIAAELPTLTMSSAEILALGDNRRRTVRELAIATILRRILSGRQLYERMVEFWSDHFNVNVRDGVTGILKTADDRDVIRPHALGRFSDLLHANAKSPAMLYYLDNYSNTKTGPNENYARELMELHTLGVSGGYTEQDVAEVARCFTGWTIARRNGTFRFAARQHDSGEKTVLGTTIAAGGGISDAEAVLDLLAAHPSTARFISEKLARRFVSDVPDPALVDALAATFTDSDGDIGQLLTTLFDHPSFWQARAEKLKRPQDLLASTLRHLGFRPRRRVIRFVADRLDAMGQQLFSWPAPNGYPDVAAYWTNTSALISRWNTANAAALAVDDAVLDGFLDGGRSPNRIISELAQNVIHRTISVRDLHVLRDTIFAGLDPNKPVADDQWLSFARVTLTALMSSRYFQNR